MNNVTKELIHIFKDTDNLDWMNYKITRSNSLTYHHIQKKSNGGEKTFENGALLTRKAHTYLHVIEGKETVIYNAINGLLKLINLQGFPPTEDQRRLMNYLMDMFYVMHEKDGTIRGKSYVRKEYKKI